WRLVELCPLGNLLGTSDPAATLPWLAWPNETGPQGFENYSHSGWNLFRLAALPRAQSLANHRRSHAVRFFGVRRSMVGCRLSAHPSRLLYPSDGRSFDRDHSLLEAGNGAFVVGSWARRSDRGGRADRIWNCLCAQCGHVGLHLFPVLTE